MDIIMVVYPHFDLILHLEIKESIFIKDLFYECIMI